MEQRIKNLSKKIIKEHYEITDAPECQNLHMLWHMYQLGSKTGTYRPFILLAELRLLQYLNYMSEDNFNNTVKLLESKDEENWFVASQVINFFRKERIKDHGEFNIKKSIYIKCREDYESKILNKEVWSKKQKLENND